jgi:hypothetical protein
MLNGFEHYGIDRDKIDVGGQVGIHVLFYDRDHLVITIYILNQYRTELSKRRFTNIEEYRTLRDEFLDRYSSCLKAIADSQP